MSAALKESQDALSHHVVTNAMMRIATRQRCGNARGAHSPSSCGSKTGHAGADTPTGVPVQKLARFLLANNHDDCANAHHSDTKGGERSYLKPNLLELLAAKNRGPMKTFQDRFCFSSTRHRPRYVRLRRNGQSGEEIRKMELNLDTISGGF
ncbi:unnamed protein product [Peronospora belbahrii]|uniref:Uncharacterized protein n=1 Tax=Peronospora belbahrii TaxID=622444 RepID=A0AAU9L536_9STRA|nr:unnamed protein product [Peronospora belbahrii]